LFRVRYAAAPWPRVKLNGKDFGVAWCAPWLVEITGALKAGATDQSGMTE